MAPTLSSGAVRYWHPSLRRPSSRQLHAGKVALVERDRIRHTVAFTLRHVEGSAEEAAFLEAGRELGKIPGVERFEVLREVSPKNGFRFGFSMEFADAAVYAAYNDDPVHVRFVRERWVPEVVDFLEVDYMALETDVP